MAVEGCTVYKGASTNSLSMTDLLTHFFYLTPERILAAVESFGFRCTGRYLALNSMENRVMEVEIEVAEETVRSPSDRFKVVKFYRPGRWTKEQILEEHRFIRDIAGADIAVVSPLETSEGETVLQCEDVPIFYSVFAKSGGRIPQEFTKDEMTRMGRLIARMHIAGAHRNAPHRMRLSPVTYGHENLSFLRSSGLMPENIAALYVPLVERHLSIWSSWFDGVSVQRIHGDLHMGNILMSSEGPKLVDFDDMVIGPPVQDLWLIIPGRDEYSKGLLDALLTGYQEIRTFDRSTLRLIEPLRTLRFIHFTAWIARRWEDPSFQRVFSEFGSSQYWREVLGDLQEQLEVIQGGWE